MADIRRIRVWYTYPYPFPAVNAVSTPPTPSQAHARHPSVAASPYRCSLSCVLTSRTPSIALFSPDLTTPRARSSRVSYRFRPSRGLGRCGRDGIGRILQGAWPFRLAPPLPRVGASAACGVACCVFAIGRCGEGRGEERVERYIALEARIVPRLGVDSDGTHFLFRASASLRYCATYRPCPSILPPRARA
ncbi:hypothetical protein B0H17DRAFT_1197431 [Mycena rosella]|uniref:Uncharacterized protein n=1 Tax=Mycena rosella TaxID=1033263 RepID=A0AAD7GJ31_MYCRO|nr:hypothetical protein B0H17DRAFT_1197431 [Mycena rosella]